MSSAIADHAFIGERRLHTVLFLLIIGGNAPDDAISLFQKLERVFQSSFLSVIIHSAVDRLVQSVYGSSQMIGETCFLFLVLLVHHVPYLSETRHASIGVMRPRQNPGGL
jgi:hypothetical protein